MVKHATITMADVRAANQQYFARGNKRFFGDVRYSLHFGKQAGTAYMVRSTYAWTDMLGQPRRLHYRINPINGATLEVESLIDTEFPTRAAALAWVREH